MGSQYAQYSAFDAQLDLLPERSRVSADSHQLSPPLTPSGPKSRYHSAFTLTQPSAFPSASYSCRPSANSLSVSLEKPASSCYTVPQSSQAWTSASWGAHGVTGYHFPPNKPHQYHGPHRAFLSSYSAPSQTTHPRHAPSPALALPPTTPHSPWPTQTAQTAQTPQVGWAHIRLPLRPGKVYYLPDSCMIPPTSILHLQRRPEGFFKHPVLLVSVDNAFAYFYALTRMPPKAIADLAMCLRLGHSSILGSHRAAFDSETLLLGQGSQVMQYETWVNLEERFKVEPQYLQHWSLDVFIDPSEACKLDRRVAWLESQQNRFIYKPLPRDLSHAPPGTIVLKPNPKGSTTTIGAPVVIIENRYPIFRFLRVKAVGDSGIFSQPLALNSLWKQNRKECLEITRGPRTGNEDAPVLLLAPNSPALRERSYVEIRLSPQWGRLDECKTWCYPHVVIQPQCIYQLSQYMDMTEQAPANCVDLLRKLPPLLNPPKNRKPLAEVSQNRSGCSKATKIKIPKIIKNKRVIAIFDEEGQDLTMKKTSGIFEEEGQDRRTEVTSGILEQEGQDYKTKETSGILEEKGQSHKTEETNGILEESQDHKMKEMGVIFENEEQDKETDGKIAILEDEETENVSAFIERALGTLYTY